MLSDVSAVMIAPFRDRVAASVLPRGGVALEPTASVAGAVAVASSLPLRCAEKHPLRGLAYGPAPAWIFRATAGIRVSDRVITTSSANQRRRRSVPLRGCFSLFADRAAQGRLDPTATAPADSSRFSRRANRQSPRLHVEPLRATCGIFRRVTSFESVARCHLPKAFPGCQRRLRRQSS